MIENYIKWLKTNDFYHSYSKRTLEAYEGYTVDFYDFMNKNQVYDVKEVNSPILRNFIKFNKNGGKSSKSGTTIKEAALNLFFYWAQENSYTDTNPVLEYKETEKKQREFGGRGGRKPVRLPPVLSLEELDRLTAEVMAGESFNKLRDAALIMLDLATGLRTEELTDLLKHKVYLDEESLRIIGKGNKERVVWINRELCETACRTYEIVREQKLAELNSESDYYFITNRGTPLTTNLVYQQVSYYMNKAEVKTERKGAHTLRHTAASLMLQNKADIITIQHNFGHKDLQTTIKYLHLIARI